LEIITGETPDISECIDFGIYDWIINKTNAEVAPPELGRGLGVSHRIGWMMSYWILPPSGIPIACTPVQRLTNLEQHTAEWQQKMSSFDADFQSKFAAQSSDISNSTQNIPRNNLLDLDGEDPEFIEAFTRAIDNKAVKHDNDDHHDPEVGTLDPYLHMELGLPRGSDNDLHLARVKRRAIDIEDRPVGQPSNNC
jgi:hypothetical protein